jgi:predicted ferric reductase
MSVALLLALRPVLLEPWLGGLDKMYRLHKWLGIAALALSTSHWLMAQGPKWLTGIGLMTRGARPPRPPLPEDPLHQFFIAQRGLAESVGEWTFYLAAALMVVALVKWFPYKFFLKTHQLLSLAYLALVGHSVILLEWSYWSTPLGVFMALLMGVGSVAAVLLLLGRLARSRKVAGQVLRVQLREKLQVLEIEIQFQGRWAGHVSGQFAFVTLHADEGPHPYTISSSWKDDGRLTFLIKALGDYTSTLPQRVAVGDTVTVEGPYGRFNFEGSKQRQIWVAGGIGITPFVARMKTLASQPDGRTVDLLHTTTVYDPQVMGLLEKDAADADVRLQVMWDKRDGLLDAKGLARMVPDWKQADIWFCGPAGFGQALRQGLLAMGMDNRSFHQEMFEMR